jgi:YVTN family beta-propeller protein
MARVHAAMAIGAVLVVAACGGPPSTGEAPLPPGESSPVASTLPSSSISASLPPLLDSSLPTASPVGSRLIDQIEVGKGPCALTSDGNDVWISALGDDDVARIDASTGRVVARLPVMTQPCGIAYVDGRLWVGGGSGSVVDADPMSGQIAHRVELDASIWDLQPGFDSIWVTDRERGELVRISASTAEVLTRIDIGGSAEGIAITADAVWVASEMDHDVVRVDPRTNTVVATVALPAGPDWFAVAPDGLWVTLTEAGEAIRIDEDANAVATRVKVGPQPLDPAIVAGAVWIADGIDGTLTVLDAKSGEVLAQLAVKTGAATDGLWVAEAAAGAGWLLDFGGSEAFRLTPAQS